MKTLAEPVAPDFECLARRLLLRSFDQLHFNIRRERLEL